MTMTIEISPELDARIQSHASRMGVTPEEIVADHLERSVPEATDELPPKSSLDALIAALTAYPVSAPRLNGSTFPRSMIYQDHD